MTTPTLTAEVLAKITRALQGCPHCKYDKAEGELMDHCAACRRKVTALAYEHWPKLLAALAAQSARRGA